MRIYTGASSVKDDNVSGQIFQGSTIEKTLGRYGRDFWLFKVGGRHPTGTLSELG